MEDIKELWQAIRPHNKEERIELVKTIGKTIILGAICFVLLYLGCK